MCYLSGTHVTIGVVSTGPVNLRPHVTQDMARQAELAARKRLQLDDITEVKRVDFQVKREEDRGLRV